MSTKCSERDGLDGEDQCCLHELPDDDEHAPGRVCCWCGDVYASEHEGSKHGEYKPSTRGAKMTEATTTEAAPYSPEEMRVALANNDVEIDRAIATAVCLERATNWILAHERDSGVKVIPALETVAAAFCVDGPAYNAGRAEGRADLCASIRAIVDLADTNRWNLDGLLEEVRRLASLDKARKTTSAPVNHYDGEACMEACRLACRGRDGIEAHLVASAIQYLWRSGRKGPALPDLVKARDMVDRLMRELGGGK